MPDETVIEQLNAATQGKRGRRWVFWVLVSVLVLFVLGAVVLCAEGWRQRSMDTALEELDQTLSAAQDHFGEGVNWPRWYRDRLKGSDGCEAWRAWIAKWSEERAEHWGHHDDLAAAIEERRREAAPPLHAEPSNTDLRKIIEETAPAVAEARALLVFDNLIGNPDLSPGYPGMNVLQWVQAITILTTRLDVLTWLDEREAAFAEIELLFALLQRMSTPQTLLEYMLTGSLELTALQGMEWLLATGPIPDALVGQARRFHARGSGNLLELCEGELAYVTQMIEMSTEGRGLVESSRTGWFEWVDLDEDIDENLVAFAFGAEEMRRANDYVRTLLNSVKSRTAPQIDPDGVTQFDMTFGRFARRQAMRVLSFQRVLASVEARAQETGGTPWTLVDLRRAEFGDLEIKRQGTDLVLQFRPGNLRDVAFGGVHQSGDFDESRPPLRLKPAR